MDSRENRKKHAAFPLSFIHPPSRATLRQNMPYPAGLLPQHIISLCLSLSLFCSSASETQWRHH